MTADWVPPFLSALSQSPSVTAACDSAGISRARAYELKGTDPTFASAWEDAHEQAVDRLEADAWRRARGDSASDTLTIFLLKSHRPGVYRETVRQIHDFSNMTDEELIRRAAGALGGSGAAGADAPGD